MIISLFACFADHTESSPPPVKQNRTRLGKLLASVSLIPSKKPSSATSTGRESYSFSTASSSAKASSSSSSSASSSGLRHSMSLTSRPAPMTRPMSMPLSRSSAAPPVSQPVLSKPPIRLSAQGAVLPPSSTDHNSVSSRPSLLQASRSGTFSKPRGSESSDEGTLKVRKTSRHSSSDKEDLSSPSAIARAFSTRLRSGLLLEQSFYF